MRQLFLTLNGPNYSKFGQGINCRLYRSSVTVTVAFVVCLVQFESNEPMRPMAHSILHSQLEMYAELNKNVFR